MQVIHADQLLTPHGRGWDTELTIAASGRIATIGPQRQTPTQPVALRRPAPLNLHSHPFQRAIAGRTKAGLCPITDSNLGNGPFNGTANPAAGGTVGCGSGSNDRMEPGALADLVGIDDDRQRLCPCPGDTAMDSLVFGGGGQPCLRNVRSAGCPVVKESRHFKRDAILTKFKRMMHQVRTAL